VLSSEFYKEGHEYLAFSGLFFDDGRKLLTSAFDNTARIWDVRTGSQLGWMERTGQRAVIAVSADGTRTLTGSDDQSAKLWKTADVLRERGGATPERVLTGHEALVTATAVSADGKWLFTGDASGHGILWNAENGEELRRLKFDEGMPAHARAI